jgi:aminoglycoside 2'-N-acetyltransferase I
VSEVPGSARTRRVRSADLSDREIDAIRDLLWAAFVGEEAMTEEDWAHSLGGVHVVLDVAGHVLAHASVVERELHVAGTPFRTGYVEAVAVRPELQGRGLGSRVMREAAAIVRESFELGALGTGTPAFYERLGWRLWLGPTFVRTADGDVRTSEDDGGILVLETPRTPLPLELTAPISCEWRIGDVW